MRTPRFAVVVGSYGKTTTARALSLGLTGVIHPHLQNNSASWPYLGVLRTTPTRPHVVLEVGISKPDDMNRYATAIRPDIVVVTSIGSEHHSSLGTLETTRAEKARMVEALRPGGVAVLNGDDPHVLWMRERTRERIITFGRSDSCDVRLLAVEQNWPEGARLRIRCGADTEVGVTSHLLGDLPQNALVASVAVAWAEGLNLDSFSTRLGTLEPMRSRLQTVPLPNGAFLIRDEVKSSFETMETALDILEDVPAGRKICVFGQISEPPGSQGPRYRELGQRLAQVADRAVLVVDKTALQRYKAGAVRAGMDPESILHVDRDALEAAAVVDEMLEPGDVVLVKGRDTEHLHRISLVLMGRDVGCAVRTCRLKLLDCDFCPHLESGWGDRLTVP